MAKTVIDLDEEALVLAMARYGTKVKKEAVNRALREAAGRHEEETDDLADWFQEVGKRLGRRIPAPPPGAGDLPARHLGVGVGWTRSGRGGAPRGGDADR